MNTNLQEVIDRFPIVTRTLAEDRYEGFLALLHEASQSQPPLSSREERKRKKALRAALQEAGVEEAAPKAEALCNAGLYAPTPAQLQLLDDPSWRDIIGLAYNLSRQQQNSHNVREAVERAAGIVMALKKYSHQGGLGERTSTSVQDTLETVLTLHHNQLKRGVEVTRHFAADVPTIQAFPNELIQVWTNLIQNALHAMEGRGILEVGVLRQGDELVVEITDNGPGVPAALQERIFEPFFTTKPMGEGSGLGLDIVRKIIERHQGRLTLESVPGRTRFSVHLPIS
jgi:signal transduction histidine kinase